MVRYPVEGGSISVVSVPLRGTGRVSESQTCFVWRDDEFKTASMQCPNDRSTVSVDPPQ